MSEKDDKFNKGSFLYIGDQDKAEWGYPEGYPHKEQAFEAITWDGTPIDYVYVDNIKVLALFSEKCPPIDAFIGAKVVTTNHDMVYIITADGITAMDETQNIYSVKLSDPISGPLSSPTFCIVYQAIESNGITFPKAGLYNFTGSAQIESITFAKTIHPMDPNFFPNATTTTSGIVKQMSYLPNATGDVPTAQNFNQLLRELKNAGLMK